MLKAKCVFTLAAFCVGLLGATPLSAQAPSVRRLSRQALPPSQRRSRSSTRSSAIRGIAGARVGAADNNITGNFRRSANPTSWKTSFRRMLILSPRQTRCSAAATASSSPYLDAKDLLAVATLPAAKDAIILDARTSDDALRQEDCRANVLPPRARAMLCGPMPSVQFLLYKKWTRWFFRSRREAGRSRLCCGRASRCISFRALGSSAERNYTSRRTHTRYRIRAISRTEQQMALSHTERARLLM